jgi:hypothetical protein
METPTKIGWLVLVLGVLAGGPIAAFNNDFLGDRLTPLIGYTMMIVSGAAAGVAIILALNLWKDFTMTIKKLAISATIGAIVFGGISVFARSGDVKAEAQKQRVSTVIPLESRPSTQPLVKSKAPDAQPKIVVVSEKKESPQTQTFNGPTVYAPNNQGSVEQHIYQAPPGRIIPEDKALEISKFLSKYAGNTVDIWQENGSPTEARKLTNQIKKILTDAGIPLNTSTGTSFPKEPPTGVDIVAGEEMDSLAIAIGNALIWAKVGNNETVHLYRSRRPREIRISVWPSDD